MNNILANLFDLEWDKMLTHSVQMVIAFLLVLPVGYNRENSKNSLGLRTFPLVSLASCSFALLGYTVNGEDTNSFARIVSGIVTGIGFIGGGAIMKKDGMIEGTSTAAAIWAAGCVGVAVAMHHLEIAILVSFFTFLIFYLARPIKATIEEKEN